MPEGTPRMCSINPWIRFPAEKTSAPPCSLHRLAAGLTRMWPIARGTLFVAVSPSDYQVVSSHVTSGMRGMAREYWEQSQVHLASLRPNNLVAASAPNIADLNEYRAPKQRGQLGEVEQ